LLENEKITEGFTKDEIDDLLNPHKYIGKSLELLENLLKFLKNKCR
jgi:adenylosuccinate lyase